MGVQIPKGKRQFWGLSGPLKSIVCRCCGVHSKKSITASARLLQPSSLLPSGNCHIYNLPVKNLPLRCGLLSKFSDHLFLSRPTSLDAKHVRLEMWLMSTAMVTERLLMCYRTGRYHLLPCRLTASIRCQISCISAVKPGKLLQTAACEMTSVFVCSF